MSMNWSELEKVATSWVYEAGQKIKKTLAGPIDIETKSNPDDLVTEVDRSIEEFFYEKIQTTYPEHYFLGEEGIASEEPSLEGTVWIIDPIDGTMNFIHQKQNFAISVAVYHNKVGMIGIIYDVMRDELFHAVRGDGAYLNNVELPPVKERPLHESVIGLNARWLVEEKNQYRNPLKALVRDVRSIRSYGSAALEMAYVASDRLDGYLSVQLSPWDYAAGIVILNEVGCVASNFQGDPLSLTEPGTLFASKPILHKEIISVYIGEEY
ncbi:MULTISPECIES: inositol monophosphatase family protein [Alkalihalophilus]|uniref:Myo-inositol-1(Or 4)-monophosphatase n=2 Tax=Alkalihalophilus pseudofirmus TaxID=79885 RepID=D3FU65_ALKPO|nr:MULTISPECIES: inositol monophosphatase family protein [Alkalihalophilus]ADC48267.1 myo-inositol-1(or 4)-monophosphatase [Alkalihalophilus pseudofirmus OF4]MDV2885429.1 inositol monophosphatase family protein [Alkalihalophilus pseudofirmus]MEC2072951.1 inositol monophosphatase family protein [Alkalihalophilus marmarensis]MED1602132.1 inositol monophosphatase family protein [Alkalihalophilus marmarensis]OLS39310.1 inositol monophosphatase [Alkalihalophilus pseudofirmus]